GDVTVGGDFVVEAARRALLGGQRHRVGADWRRRRQVRRQARRQVGLHVRSPPRSGRQRDVLRVEHGDADAARLDGGAVHATPVDRRVTAVRPDVVDAVGDDEQDLLGLVPGIVGAVTGILYIHR